MSDVFTEQATGIVVNWYALEATGVYHAFRNPEREHRALCGVIGVKDGLRAPSYGLENPASSVMTCENCAGLVARKPEPPSVSEKHRMVERALERAKKAKHLGMSLGQLAEWERQGG